MRVGFYINNLWGISATARIAYFLAKEFRKKGVETIFLLNKDQIDIAKEFEIIVLKGRGDLDRAIEIGKLASQLNLKAIYGFMRPQSVVLGLAKLFKPSLKVKLIGSVRGNNNFASYDKWYHLPYRFLEKFILERNDKIIVVSKAVKKDLERAFFLNPKKLEVIYNPIDPHFVKRKSKEPIEKELRDIFKNPVIVNVARMEPEKGLHHLIEIFERVNKKLPETRLVLIGDGSQRGKLETFIQKKGLKERVYLLGWKQNPFKYMARSKVFALTSLWEGFGLVLLEAMVLGVPPLAFKTEGGHTEVLEDCCPLIEYPNEELYAEEIVKLLTDKDYYLSVKRKLNERVKNFFPEAVAKQYLRLIS
ncbi:MAG: hypothetical protein DSZ31_06375 [Gammaproteobacteria bacterium]|nr:MAG: hypothetical protein DSZ31_06375 [Gammaproteobacteria bacterium]